jgi:hypothetical protein
VSLDPELGAVLLAAGIGIAIGVAGRLRRSRFCQTCGRLRKSVLCTCERVAERLEKELP